MQNTHRLAFSKQNSFLKKKSYKIMARFVMVCFVFFGILMVQAMADHKSMGSSGPNPQEIEVQNNQNKVVSNGVVVVVARVADQPSSRTSDEGGDGEDESGNVAAEAPEMVNRRLGKHHSTDKSVAGGGVIIGGLVTAIFAAVFCYIRVTRRRDGDH